MGDLTDSLADPDVLRLENLDTDLRPPHSALEGCDAIFGEVLDFVVNI